MSYCLQREHNPGPCHLGGCTSAAYECREPKQNNPPMGKCGSKSKQSMIANDIEQYDYESAVVQFDEDGESRRLRRAERNISLLQSLCLYHCKSTQGMS